MRDLSMVALIIVALGFGFARGALVGPETAERTLKANGFSDVRITDHVWFAIGWRGCDANDAARFDAVATNAAGEEVNVFVCCGLLFKGGTIRVD